MAKTQDTKKLTPENEEVRKWLGEIKTATRDHEKWHKRVKKIVARYKEEQAFADSPETIAGKRFALLYSNVQTIGPTLYSRRPKPQVEPRKKNGDPAPRKASSLLEEALTYSISSYDFNSRMIRCRLDVLLGGRAQGWVRYVPHIETIPTPIYPDQAGNLVQADGTPIDNFDPKKVQQSPLGPVYPMERLVSEEVICDYVHILDYLHNFARTEDEVRWKARRVYMGKDEVETRFGSKVVDKMKFQPMREEGMEKSSESTGGEKSAKAQIWEIWDKPSKCVYWVSPGCDCYLDKQKDPLGLQRFWPCPAPLLATTTNDSILPIPDYVYYQDQAEALDDIATRKALLREAIRVVGCYDASKPELARIVNEAVQNAMIPVADWATFSQAGGLKGSVDFFPLDILVAVYQQLDRAEQEEKAKAHEITGISDIIRGNSSPSESATAQQIKGQFATLRLNDRQQGMQTFVKEILEIKAEIISEKFQPRTIAEMTSANLNDPQEAQEFEAAIALLKNELLRNYKVDIETDSTIAVDEQMDKEARTEFLTAVGPFMQQSFQMIQQNPDQAELAKELLMFVVRAYKAGRALEATIEQTLQSMADQAIQAQENPTPDPAQADFEAKQQIEQAKVSIAQMKAQADIEIKQAKAQAEAQVQALKNSIEMQRAQFEAALESEKLRGTMELHAEKIRGELNIKAMTAADSANAQTIADVSSTPATPPAPVFNLTVSPVIHSGGVKKKVLQFQRSPVVPGSFVGSVDSIPDEPEIVGVPEEADPIIAGI